MKFKEQRGNVFVFDVDGVDESLVSSKCDDFYEFIGKEIAIREDFAIRHDEYSVAYLKDIQTAVQMMQILIDRGLV